MWRVTLLFCLVCSLTLNVYLFLQINVTTVENRILPKADEILVTSAPLNAKSAKGSNAKNAINANNEAFTNAEGKTPSSIATASASTTLVSTIKKAIDLKEYITASFLSNSLLISQRSDANSEVDVEEQLAEIKKYWLYKTNNLIESSHFIDAENSINAYLEFQRDDVDFLYQQVELLLQQNLLEVAIKNAYEVEYHVFDEVNKNKATLNARKLVQKETDVLIQDGLWLELRDLVEQVLILDPENNYLYWLLVRAQYELGEFDHAGHAIQPLLELPNYRVKAEALLVKIESALKRPESIALIRQGEHFIVDALINNNTEVSLMLDTGASISLLSEPAFEELSQYSEMTYLEDIQMSTAGGVIVASLYQVNEIAIQGYVVNDFVFAVSSFVSDKNDGLLGMNFLKQFDFHIDQTNSSLILQNK